ncbi:conserved hypothetical protein [Ricinus communis]|uniref:Uncharacterized protein n=1 Tax=Ricinus communis TaxID=3988 RepID=B9RSK6_RICCO|nr:conserved hypothetical protein [Ricinus communis]
MHLKRSKSVERETIVPFDLEIEKTCKANRRNKKEHMANERNVVVVVEENIPRLRDL